MSRHVSCHSEASREDKLFIFGYGNLGSSVADLAARIIIRTPNENESLDCSPQLVTESVHLNGSGALYKDGLSFPAFASITATVRRVSKTDCGAFHSQNLEGVVTMGNHLFVSSNTSVSINFVDFDEPDAVTEYLSEATHVLITIPPVLSQLSREQENQTRDFHCEDAVLSSKYNYVKLIPYHAWVGYVSTTGVYGDHNGSWVNETSDTRATPFSKAWAYLQIESQWKYELCKKQNKNLVIFRCAGLYGSQSSAIHTVSQRLLEESSDASDLFNKTIMKAESMNNYVEKEEFATSRIHITDASRAIISSMLSTLNTDGSCSVYNLADNEPELRSVVMAYAEELLLRELQSHHAGFDSLLSGSKRKGKKGTFFSERRNRRTSDNKRVSNYKLLKLLHSYGGLMYPSYRDGLVSILRQAREKIL
eukprot:CAMPEP_0172426496 /NCGR_PEP_ID=MMETSP1064-20121228/37711_1 /TAXON_ID=202472 /ORGANISM="Aulacoseira subarctica , Strain CCAP 1002/5" /LENGTH=421 /DNA_ID=CAMNT_0013170121 /DNA_START=206 /DNA_END=1471 /DNA_ORIENTATION=+